MCQFGQNAVCDTMTVVLCVQVVHGLKQKILKLEGQLRDREAAYRSGVDVSC